MSFSKLTTVTPWFWDIIAKGHRDSARLRSILEKLDRKELERFHSEFEWAITALCDDDFRAGHHYTKDEMQELAGWIASQGMEYFASIYDNPETVPSKDDVDVSTSFDGIVRDVYWDRYGEELPYPG
jgi:hypothetical protein